MIMPFTYLTTLLLLSSTIAQATVLLIPVVKEGTEWYQLFQMPTNSDGSAGWLKPFSSTTQLSAAEITTHFRNTVSLRSLSDANIHNDKRAADVTVQYIRFDKRVAVPHTTWSALNDIKFLPLTCGIRTEEAPFYAKLPIESLDRLSLCTAEPASAASIAASTTTASSTPATATSPSSSTPPVTTPSPSSPATTTGTSSSESPSSSAEKKDEKKVQIQKPIAITTYLAYHAKKKRPLQRLHPKRSYRLWLRRTHQRKRNRRMKMLAIRRLYTARARSRYS